VSCPGRWAGDRDAVASAVAAWASGLRFPRSHSSTRSAPFQARTHALGANAIGMATSQIRHGTQSATEATPSSAPRPLRPKPCRKPLRVSPRSQRSLAAGRVLLRLSSRNSYAECPNGHRECRKPVASRSQEMLNSRTRGLRTEFLNWVFSVMRSPTGSPEHDRATTSSTSPTSPSVLDSPVHSSPLAIFPPNEDPAQN